jgi:glycosyltransferase involved in cell wall biosynthesis
LRAWNPGDAKVSVVGLREEGPLRQAFEHEAARLGGTVHGLRGSWMGVAAAGRSVSRIAREAGATHLHAHLLLADAVGRRAAALAALPYLVTEHGIHSWSEKGRVLRPAVGAWYRRTLRPGMRIAAISARVGRDLVRNGIDRRYVHVITNGIELQRFAPALPHQRHDARQRLGVPSDAFPVMLVMGGLVGRKSPATALRALAELRKNAFPAAHLVFAGTGPLEETLRAEAARLGVAGFVQFAGFVEDPGTALAAADLLLHPAVDEPFGLVLAEALAAGLPVVTRAGAVPEELVLPSPLGHSAFGEAAEEWAGAVSGAASAIAERREEVARRACLYAEEHFAVSDTAQKYLRLYHSQEAALRC